MKVKTFVGDHRHVEADLNKWLGENDIEIIHLTSSFDPRLRVSGGYEVLIVVIYKTR